MKRIAATFALTIASFSAQAEGISGVWYGIAPYVDGNPDFDHQTVLYVQNAPQTSISQITYIYPALDITCYSELSFVEVHSTGSLPNVKRIWTFDDVSANCDSGSVRLTVPLNISGPSDSIYFEWIDNGGHVDNAGTLSRVDLPLP